MNLTQTAPRVLPKTIEMERRQLARRLHDVTGSGLTSIQLQLDWIERNGCAETAKRAAMAMTELKNLSRTCRQITAQTRQGLDQASLIDALEVHFQSVRMSADLPIRFDYSHQTSAIPANVATAIYYTAVESLTNVVRHAAATQVTVSLMAHARTVSLEVSDNGTGFEPRRTGLGLTGIQEQAQELNGWVEISSAPDSGTSVLLLLPLDPNTNTQNKEIFAHG